MEDQLSTLYRKIQQGKLSDQQAAEQLQRLLSVSGEQESSLSEMPHEEKEDDTSEKAIRYVKKILSSSLMLPERQIDAHAPLENYGIDSVMVMKLTDQLEQQFGPLSKTLFYEYQNIAELAGYFMSHHRERLEQLTGVQAKSNPDVQLRTSELESSTIRKSESPNSFDMRQRSAGSRRRIPAATNASGESTSEEHVHSKSLDIAIIGMSGRYPKSSNLEQFWENLKHGKDCITEIPEDRWDYRIHTEMNASKGKQSGKWGGFLDGVDRFDPLFFQISPKEAERIDPQERLFLECVYETLQDAGYTRGQAAGPDAPPDQIGNVGVFAGVMYQEYQLYGAEARIAGREPFALNGNPASIANRVSYFCNFHGPSMVVDTMCSSSLTAIHLACQSLSKKECRTAIAGGVNVSVHPNKYVMLTQGQFLSSKGRCESFGEGGDGYVPGEGVGAVMLKPLSRAIADGDHIYGVIKGTAVNHGGKTNGYTVPNPARQAEVIETAVAEAGIDITDISYIEAHGTGTSLGDPIEITGLTQAFRKGKAANSKCAIGSAKSNIGHCESAAGIAGLTKVLLQMQHRQLVPSIHADPPNPHIQFDKTPFAVQKQLSDWDRITIDSGDSTQEVPRIAGISSFGAGGSNAHIIVQEYCPEQSDMLPIEQDKPAKQQALIVLSARNEKQLRELCERMLTALRSNRYQEEQLANIAYTLQTGREMMNMRLGIVTGSLQELSSKLESYCSGDQDMDDMYVGYAGDAQQPLSILSTDADMSHTLMNWITKRKFGKLLEFWVKGLNVDWNLLHDGFTHHKISLPTYPFAKERYWVSGEPPVEFRMKGDSSLNGYSGHIPFIHPLLHENKSNLSEQKYVTVLTGQEFYLNDHRIGQERILPGAAYLEMAHAAVSDALGEQQGENVAVILKNHVWMRPLVVKETPVSLHIRLHASLETQPIQYEMYSEMSADGPGENRVYSSGYASIVSLEDELVAAMAVNPGEIKARCNTKRFSADQCYQMYEQGGLNYGPAHRLLVELNVGAGEVLGQLRLPSVLKHEMHSYVMHPAILDGALQSAIGLWMEDQEGKEGKELENANSMLPIPYAMDELQVLGSFTEEMWAHVRYSSDSASSAAHAMPRLDIDLFSSTGVPCVFIQGLSCRALNNGIVPGAEPHGRATAMLVPRWEKIAAVRNDWNHPFDRHIVMLAEPWAGLAEEIKERLKQEELPTEIVALGSEKIADIDNVGASSKRFASASTQVLHVLQQLVSSPANAENVLIQLLYSREDHFQLYSGLTGLLRTAALENPRIHVQFIEDMAEVGSESKSRPRETPNAKRAAELIKINRESEDISIGYQGAQRQVLHWKALHLPAKTEVMPWKNGGVYLITGGAGGLGHIFAREIASKVVNTTLVLTGRSDMSAKQEQVWEPLKTNGTTIIYRQGDISREKDTSELVAYIQHNFGRLDGIIHSAGLTGDQYILNKTKAEMEKVMAPKVAGTFYLDEATRAMKLDFFILFSSMSGVYGNPGQCDYAAANAYMGSYAQYRHQLMLAGKRQGRTLAIHWPLWKDGGMHLSPVEEKALWENTGMRPLAIEAGITLLYKAFHSTECEIIGVQGDIPKLISSLEARWNMNRATQDIPNVSEADAMSVLQELAAELLGVGPDEISREADWLEYGLDQPQLTLLAQRLNERCGLDLSHVLFVEYPTLQSASAFLSQRYPSAFPSAPLVPESEPLPRTSQTSLPTDRLAKHTQTTAADYILAEALDTFLKKALSAVLKVPADQIVSHARLEEYGIDSISITQLTDQLEGTFGPLSKTLLFEYQTLKELREYLIKAHGDTVNRLISVPELPCEERKERSDKTKTARAGLQHPPFRAFQRPAQSSSVPADAQVRSLAKDIAIIGLSGRYPEANDLEQFWENLMQGRDSVTEIPLDRWDHRLHMHHADPNSPKPGSKWGGFLQGVDRFDPLFFHISPREAQMMDPQERLFLETAYDAIEDAGYTPEGLASATGDTWGNKVGVYVGVMYEEYQLYAAQAQAKGDSSIALSGNPASIANRISYYCNFNGPSMAVDTMCSSSLTAIHLACQSLVLKECEVAVAGGVNVSIHPNKYILLNQGGFLSSEGRCKSFGAQGDGYVPSEGVGAVILKPLNKAIEDGDHIYGVIKGSALNHGGKTNGYTVPNPAAQSCVIGRAIAEADISADTITYVEAHGTGTSLGDPIEVAGLSKAFAESTDQQQFCALGSVKSNIGHAESAAGIAGLTKILLQLKHGQLVPSLHSDPANPNIDFAQTPFRVQRDAEAWKPLQRMEDGKLVQIPRRAGLSSFGAGGSNAHLIIEEADYPPHEEGSLNEATRGGAAIIVLSARTRSALRERARRLLTAVDEKHLTGGATEEPECLLERLAFTLQTGRQEMEERLGFVVRSVQELKERLHLFLGNENINEALDGIDGMYLGNIKSYQAVQAAIAMDEHFGEVVSRWLNEGLYGKVLDLWVKGIKADWSVLYSTEQPRRISLPGYPFERERCWFELPEEAAIREHVDRLNSAVSAGIQKAAPERQMTAYHKDWQLADIASMSDERNSAGKILILANRESAALAARLTEHFKHTVVLNEEQLDDPGRHWLEDEERLKHGLTGLIDLTACMSQITVDDSCAEQIRPAWLKLMQDVIEIHGHEGMLLLLVTNGLESFRNSKVNLAHASRAGLFRMLQAEYRSIQSRHLDVDPSASEEAKIKCITTEFRQTDREPEICYRDGKRWRSYMRELSYGESINNNVTESSIDPERPILEANQVLWITGGTRGLGMACARHFVKHHNVKRLLLTGREAIPQREEWEAYASHDTAIGTKIRSLLELEHLGAEVLVTDISLTNESAIQAELARVKRTMGPVGGIIHCAGNVDHANPAFIRKQADAIQRVLDPKTGGMHALYHALRHEPLRFFVLFSSVSSAMPSLGAGQSDYVMANAYMDYFAEAVSQESAINPFPVISIQWPSWQESGFGAVTSEAYRQSGLLSITDAEGMLWLDRIIRENRGPVILPAVVASQTVHKAEQQAEHQAEASLSEAQKMSIPLIPRPVERMTASLTEELENRTLAWLKALMAKELRLDESRLDEDTPFQHYGMDSILLVQVLTVMDRQLQHVAIDPSLLLEHPTLRQLAKHLVRIYPESLADLLMEANSKLGGNSTEKPSDVRSAHSIPVQHAEPDMEVRTGLNELNDPVDEAYEKPAELEQTKKRDKIAIVGVACHFPDADNPAQFWSNLQKGRDSMTEIPAERLRLTGSSTHRTSASSKRIGAFIRDIEQFDPEFFRMTDTLAEQLDPLQRQLLEVSVEAAADAGYSRERLWNSQTGVFVGSRASNFSSKLGGSTKDTIVGIGQNFIAAHLSHFYNLKGPNMVVDTACSSSLTAVHLAVRSLLDGECDLAFAGGVDILLDDAPYEMLGAASVLSPDSRCKTFSADANGIGLGEGCGVVLLKPLSQAIADQDTIYGVIDGTSINNDGQTMGITTPNPEAQQELLEKAMSNASIHPSTISYIETHGTGTLIGDPIELKALTGVFAKYTNQRQFCGVGSVKSNIGHLLSASGIASLIKVLLSLAHRELPPTIHCDQPNPRFQFGESPFYIVQQHQPWGNGPSDTLRAGISAFGLGGNNAHIIVSNEGIPAERMVSLPLRSPDSPFQRKYCWPPVKATESVETSSIVSAASPMQQLSEQSEHSSFFDFIKL
ncbi:SDR family NAD(P)-dependent oxidoreductase [Paenibacillus polymyxa]|uniref:SDR family NAD(P)-dependent oxidoreductase n=1 Tax=Paenibacillus polymyxa TaxID=1406 RepID=UPI001BE60234|nr:SDR family NAD(P)-dependent oxidoreductase [Paenibacillus polymyxa]MBT2282523.1 SDR family NAD(P)-dependent oxidoreductase [Paenibacillus polymyxa]